MEELKPCPFCGCHEVESRIHVMNCGVRNFIECMNPACGAVVISPWSTSIATAKKRAAKMWNRRANECNMTTELVCPYCGHEHTDIDELDDFAYGFVCESCGKKFNYASSMEACYMSWKIDEE